MQFSAEAFQEGQVLLIDKPLHWSSFQAVNKIKWLLKKEYGLKKIKVRTRRNARSFSYWVITDLYRKSN
ncbi:hypothetical protein M2306_002450 [Myroides gitamensis]|nr:hypothetical protein [Myroides gitamensis]